MRSAHIYLTLVLAAAALSGCTVQQKSAAKFQGPERDVAKVVDDLAAAGRSSDSDKICTRILTAQLAEKMTAGAATCSDEVKKAIQDAGDYDLEVRDVTVTGTTAQAQVRQKGSDEVVTLGLERGGDGWRVSSLG